MPRVDGNFGNVISAVDEVFCFAWDEILWNIGPAADDVFCFALDVLLGSFGNATFAADELFSSALDDFCGIAGLVVDVVFSFALDGLFENLDSASGEVLSFEWGENFWELWFLMVRGLRLRLGRDLLELGLHCRGGPWTASHRS